MVELIVILENDLCFFDKCQHIKIVLTDVDVGNQFLVSYPSGANQQIRSVPVGRYFYQPYKDRICLYSHKNLAEFISAYKEKIKAEDFCYAGPNCADAALYTLNYFCPEPRWRQREFVEDAFCIQESLCCKSTLAIALLLLSCGFIVPSFSSINTPQKCFEDAKRRSMFYGLDNELLNIPLLAESTGPIPQVME